MKHLKITLILSLLIFCICNTVSAQKKYKILYAENKLDIIEKISNDKINKSTSLVDDYYWNAFSLHERGMLTESLENLKKGLNKFPDSKLLKKQIATYYYEAGNYYSAKKYLQEYIGDFKSAMLLCEIHEINSDYKKAIKLLIKLLKNNRNNTVCIKHLAYNYYKLERYGEAELHYLIALDKNKLDQTVAKKLISIYNKAERYKESIKIARPILKNDSLNTAFLRLSGFAYIKINKYTKAQKLFKRLYLNGDTTAYTLKHLGFAELKSKMYYDAQVHLKHAHVKDTTDYLTCYLLGISYLDTGDKKEGQIYLDKALNSLKPNPKTLSSIFTAKASLYKGSNDYKDAIKMYAEAYKVGKQPINLFYMGSIYEANLKNYKMALSYFQLFLKKIENIEADKTKEGALEGSIKNIAERHIEEIKKEMFFNGDIKK